MLQEGTARVIALAPGQVCVITSGVTDALPQLDALRRRTVGVLFAGVASTKLTGARLEDYGQPVSDLQDWFRS